jgi:Domain of unknown function (DUF4292)
LQTGNFTDNIAGDFRPNLRKLHLQPSANFFTMLRIPSALLLCLLLLTACSKKVVVPLPPPPKTLDIQEIDFDYLHGKARLNFKDDKKERDVKATIRIRKDSVIWMTFSVIGVQGGKALINKDSITIVSTIDREYYVFDYAELSKRFNFNINFGIIQAAMLGNLVIPRSNGDNILEAADYNMLDQQIGNVMIRNYINPTTKKLEKLELSESTTGNAIKINYSNFQPLGNKTFPYTGSISVLYKIASGVINNTITFEYNKAEIGDRELRFPFNIPKRYERR